MNDNTAKFLNYISYVSVAVIIVGLLLSRATMSIGMISLAACLILKGNYRTLWDEFKSQPLLWVITIYFFIILLSGLYSDNWGWLGNRLLLKLPFLVMPFAILALPKLDRHIYYRFLALFFFLILGTALWILGWYVSNYATMNEAYLAGTVLPTPVMHIRYSLMVVYSIFIGVQLYGSRFSILWKWERYLYLIGSIILFIFAHILAVRTGILSLYTALFILGVYHVWKSGKIWQGAIGILVLGVCGYLAIQHIPTLNSKLNYTIYSLNEIKHNKDISRLSDSYRIASIQAGINVGNTSPIFGVGVGDLKDETARYVQEHYPELAHEKYTPQNQFVHSYAALGLIGLLIFSFVVFFPLSVIQVREEMQLMAFHCIMLSSFLVEQTLESQLGIALYLIFAVLGARYVMESKENSTDL